MLLAETEFREGESLLGGSQGARGRELVQAALERLRPLAVNEGVNIRERFRVRRLAGWIQLRLGNGQAAVNHLRRAREFDPDEAGLRLALARALVLAAGGSTGEEREGRLTEALELMGTLELEGDPGMRQDLAALRSAIDELGAR